MLFFRIALYFNEIFVAFLCSKCTAVDNFSLWYLFFRWLKQAAMEFKYLQKFRRDYNREAFNKSNFCLAV